MNVLSWTERHDNIIVQDDGAQTITTVEKARYVLNLEEIQLISLVMARRETEHGHFEAVPEEEMSVRIALKGSGHLTISARDLKDSGWTYESLLYRWAETCG